MSEKSDRRTFVAQVSAGGVALAASPVLAAGQSIAPRAVLDDFTPHLEKQFTLRNEAGEQCAAQLVEAKSLGKPAREGFRAPFSLVFQLPRGKKGEQGIYQLRHSNLHLQHVLMTPINAKHDCLEVIFA